MKFWPHLCIIKPACRYCADVVTGSISALAAIIVISFRIKSKISFAMAENMIISK